MTIEELLKLVDTEPDAVARMSDEELTRHLIPYFPQTRPKDSETTVIDAMEGMGVLERARAINQKKKEAASAGFQMQGASFSQRVVDTSEE